MKIAFFSESNFIGKIPRDFDNMRTEYAWYVGLNSQHFPIFNIPSNLDEKIDLGVVIIPKTKIGELMKVDLIKRMKKICTKIGFMQEGPYWYFQDYPMEQQIWFYKTLMEMDVIFGHYESDVDYWKGLTQKKGKLKRPYLKEKTLVMKKKEINLMKAVKKERSLMKIVKSIFVRRI